MLLFYLISVTFLNCQFGIGTLWELNGLESNCNYITNSLASQRYREISGCTGAVPLEQTGGEGTACAHWDEGCFQSELMTGFTTGGLGTYRI